LKIFLETVSIMSGIMRKRTGFLILFGSLLFTLAMFFSISGISQMVFHPIEKITLQHKLLETKNLRQARMVVAGTNEMVPRVAFLNPSGKVPGGQENNDLLSLKFSLVVAGVRFDETSTEEPNPANLGGYDIIIVPFAAAKTLTKDQAGLIANIVSGGASVIIDGRSELSDALGIKLSDSHVAVEDALDTDYPETSLHWSRWADVAPVDVSKTPGCKVLCREKRTGAPLVVSGSCGRGRYVYFATLFDPYTDKGYSRFPFLVETLSSECGLRPLFEREISAVYFDPGIRFGMDPAELVAVWKNNGIHIIYAGGWHYDDGYDYGRLIRLCHENAILVYCWLEPPMISERFWNEYPAWREKTAVLTDARIDWRSLMNLADPGCRALVFKQLQEFLNKYDWDGANVAELYFETANGPEDDAHFTPMNSLVRSGFKATYGFDPVDIFDPDSAHFWKTNYKDWAKYTGYRKALCNDLKKSYLNLLSDVRRNKKDFEIIMTAIDASVFPRLEDYISEDTAYLMKLQKKYGITLQVEDEWMFWSGKPERYQSMAKNYRRVINDDPRLEIDCNVVECHPDGMGGLPSEKPTGEELRQIVYYISQSGSRPVFYSEDTILPRDFRNINTVLAREAVATPAPDGNGWEINTPYSVTFHAQNQGKIPLLDGKTWLAGEGEDVIVPAGRHSLSLGSALPAGNAPRLVAISSRLVSARFYDNIVEFSYSEDSSSCYVVISGRPGNIFVDGRPESPTTYMTDSSFSIKLPGGSHRVKVFTTLLQADKSELSSGR
jgi:hypothetical protein